MCLGLFWTYEWHDGSTKDFNNMMRGRWNTKITCLWHPTHKSPFYFIYLSFLLMFYSPLPSPKESVCVCVCGTYAHTHRLKVLKVATQRCMIDKRQEMKHSLESFTSHQTSAEICFAVQNCALNKCFFCCCFSSSCSQEGLPILLSFPPIICCSLGRLLTNLL